MVNWCVVAVIGVGCAGGDLEDSLDPPRLENLAVTPAEVELQETDSVRLRAVGTWSDGTRGSPPVTWSATGGTVSDSGLYIAGVRPGIYDATARSVSGGLTASSIITIRARLVGLVGVVLTPATASLEIGQTLQFSAAGVLSDGSPASVSVVYSTTGGAISAGGLYTAPATTGTFQVIAREQGGILADTSSVSVVASPVPTVNECAVPQPAWIWCDDFEQDRRASYFEVDNAGGNFARASGVGHGGSWGMKAHFGVGRVSVGSLKLAFGRTPQAYFRPADAGTALYRELYWRVYLRNQPGWTGGGGDKLSRATIFASSTSWAQAMAAHVWSGGANNGDRYHLVIDPASGTDAQGNLKTTTYNDFANLRWLGSVRSATPIFDAQHVGQWHCVEAHVRLNDPGQSNGLFELWINGIPEASKAGLNWIGSYSAYGLNAVFLENYWNAGSPALQERFMDRFVVSTSAIGC